VQRMAQCQSQQLDSLLSSHTMAEQKSYTAMQLERKFSRQICSFTARILTP
jgi:hypothetical protein